MLYNVLIVKMPTAAMPMKKDGAEGQMMEAVHVACAVREGASLVHGVQMMNKVEELAI